MSRLMTLYGTAKGMMDGCHYDPNETNAENQRKFHNDVHEKVPLDFLFSLKKYAIDKSIPYLSQE